MVTLCNTVLQRRWEASSRRKRRGARSLRKRSGRYQQYFLHHLLFVTRHGRTCVKPFILSQCIKVNCSVLLSLCWFVDGSHVDLWMFWKCFFVSFCVNIGLFTNFFIVLNQVKFGQYFPIILEAIYLYYSGKAQPNLVRSSNYKHVLNTSMFDCLVYWVQWFSNLHHVI